LRVSVIHRRHLGQSLILHWNGRVWTQVASPDPGSQGNDLSGVPAVSGTDAWAAGSTKNGTKESSLILRWNGHSWNRASSPSPGSTSLLYSVAATSHTSVWTVGGTGSTTRDPAVERLPLGSRAELQAG
jgi:hypothetical protein